MKYRDEQHRFRVLLVNSDKLAQESLYEMLCRSGYSVDIAESVKEAVSRLDEAVCHIVLADLSGADGLELVKIVKERSYPQEVILLASYGNIENAVSSMKIGAFDYLVRPVEDKKIISAIERALAKRQHPAETETKALPERKIQIKDDTYHGLVGKSDRMREIYSVIERISNSKATILLRGESGTGKRMIARAMHKADKRRRNMPFIELSCGALPREIIESELFGHTKGAFTGAINDRKGRFELAHGGTILLDDIDSFSLDLQVKLLRVLQHKEFERVGDHKTMKVDVRIIVSTNQDLEKAVAEKKFREDLYYRLNVISINIPPLRERKEDLPPLLDHFIRLYSKENHKRIESVSPDVLTILMNYNWPGNIRELENIVERAVILDMDNVIDRDDLPEIIRNSITVLEKGAAVNGEEGIPASLKAALEEPEKVYILQILKEVGWNKKKAARKLGVNRTTLYNKLKKYNILTLLDNE